MDLKSRMQADRAMRDAAKRLLSTDWRFFREDLSAGSVASRIGNRLTYGAKALADDAEDFAKDNKGLVGGWAAALFAGLGLWFFADRIFGDEQEHNEPEEGSTRD